MATKTAVVLEGEDDDEGQLGAFEGGHWYWNDVEGCLLFVSDLPVQIEETVLVTSKVLAIGAVEFKELDVVEQMRFRKRYQRKLKHNEPDVITLQDIKDLVIYMAPVTIQSATLINMLHIPTTERFIRALTLYCQYYLQIAQEMAERMKALELQIRTPTSEEIEATFRDDLCDLRSLVAKEYCTFLLGIKDTKGFHHMGTTKKRKSLSFKDARLFETFILMCIQIVWIALGRRAYNQLEVEINRMFKTEIFNSVEHRLKTGYITKMTSYERDVLIGPCARSETKLITRSPFTNEVFCRNRSTDYRVMGVGSIKYKYLPPRLRYFSLAIAGPEENLTAMGVTVGILGKSRSCFDIALHLVNVPVVTSKQRGGSTGSTASTSLGGQSTGTVTSPQQSKSSQQSASAESAAQHSKASHKSVALDKRKDSIKLYGYADIVLPVDEHDETVNLPPVFPAEDAKVRLCSREQRLRWISRLFRLRNAPVNMRTSEYMPEHAGSRVGV